MSSTEPKTPIHIAQDYNFSTFHLGRKETTKEYYSVPSGKLIAMITPLQRTDSLITAPHDSLIALPHISLIAVPQAYLIAVPHVSFIALPHVSLIAVPHVSLIDYISCQPHYCTSCQPHCMQVIA